jgi:hypothetical protein
MAASLNGGQNADKFRAKIEYRGDISHTLQLGSLYHWKNTYPFTNLMSV